VFLSKVNLRWALCMERVPVISPVNVTVFAFIDVRSWMPRTRLKASWSNLSGSLRVAVEPVQVLARMIWELPSMRPPVVLKFTPGGGQKNMGPGPASGPDVGLTVKGKANVA